MFRKNPLVELELNYLREAFPNHWWQYLLLVPAYVMVYLPLVKEHPSRIVIDEFSLFLLFGFFLFVVLGTFWIIQLGLTLLAAHMIRRPYTEEEAIVTGYGAGEILMGKFWAILQHSSSWLVFWMPIAIISTRTLKVFLRDPRISLFDAVDTGMWVDSNWDIKIVEFPALLVIPILAIFAISAISLGIGFYFGISSRMPLASALFSRVTFVIGAILVMIVCSTLRFTWLSHVKPIFLSSAPDGSSFPFNQTEEYARLVLISLEMSASMPLDNGILGMSVISTCIYSFEDFRVPFVLGNLIAMGVGIFGQLGLSAFLLWRTSHGMGKKKK